MGETTLPHRQVIAASWQRVAQTGLTRDAVAAPAVHDIAGADPLLDAARPVLAQAETLLHDTETALLLVDHDCRLVAKVSGATGLAQQLESAGLVTGAVTDEDTIGTSGLGTPAEVRGAVTIHSGDHYLEQFGHLSCYGEPIIHPTTHRLAGVLCLAEVAGTASPLSVPVVRNLVNGVTDRLLSRSHADQHAILAAFERTSARRNEALTAIGGDVHLANARARSLLTDADMGTLSTLVDTPDGTLIHLTLTSGVAAEVLVERVPGDADAALFTIRRAPAAEVSPPTVTPLTGDSIAITGDAGTGRTTRALDEIGDLPHRIVDVAAGLISGAGIDIGDELRAAHAAGEALVIDGADLLDDRGLALLTAAAGSAARNRPLVVVTGRAAGARPEVSGLTARCRHRIDLPPLRHRSPELAVLAQNILDRDDEGLGLTAAAVDSLVCHEWPGNLAELCRVLGDAGAAARARSSKAIDVADLPPGYRSTTRAARLSGREQAERRAIIDALEAADGNKKHAATALGVSRTTLYARIKALGIRA